MKKKLFQFSSIKTKLSLAFVSMSLLTVGIYIWVAKSTFESDKIAYVFESQQTQLETALKNLNSQIEHSITTAKSLLLTFDSSTKTLNNLGQQFFKADSSLLGIEVYNESKSELLTSVAKEKITLPPPAPDEAFLEIGKIEVFSLSDHDKILLVGRETGPKKEIIKFRILIQVPEVFQKSSSHVFILSDGPNILKSFGEDIVDPAEVMKQLDFKESFKTLISSISGKDFLISQGKADYGKLNLVILTPKDAAMAALRVLYRKSLVFLTLTSFATIGVALLLSVGLMKGLAFLTEAATRLGQGDFESNIRIESSDEIGILSGAFEQMKSEILRLLKETAESARMAGELKTAHEVQETLFPSKTIIRSGSVTINGQYRSASECGGDWWWHWTVGEKIFVFLTDATGHGVPAALLTSAARSAIGTLETLGESRLEKIVETLSSAIHQITQGKRTMSGFFVEIFPQTRMIRYVNASHLAALVIPTRSPELLKWSDTVHVDDPISPPVGAKAGTKYKIGEYQLNPGDRMVLLTDGLTERKNSKGQMLSDRKFTAQVFNVHQKTHFQIEAFTKGLFEMSDEFSEGTPQDDDLTVITIDV